MKPIRKENPKRMASNLSDAIDAVDLGIRRYLLHRHLAHWHLISTAPHNQDLEDTGSGRKRFGRNSISLPTDQCQRLDQYRSRHARLHAAS
jgi:hypothetical protein